MKKFIHPLLAGMLLFPLATLIHECGHFLTALAFDAHPQLHPSFVSLAGQVTATALFCIKAGGPLVDLLCVAGGLMWLRRLRSSGIPGWRHWFAFALVQRAVSPLVGFKMLLTGQLPLPDDATMSVILGLSKWALPGIFAVFWLSALVAAFRLLPKGWRLLPFLGVHLGGLVGSVVVGVCWHLWQPPG